MLLGCLVGTLAAPVSALAADDLVVLDGDPAPLLQGTRTYAKVYINSTLRLTNNTVLNVDSLYIGPRAQLLSCWVPDPANPLEAGDPAGCTNGRSLTIRSRGAVQITPPISLLGGTGPVRAGGTLFITGSAITLGGAVNTSGTGGLPSGNVTLATGGLLRVQSVAAPGAVVSLNGARGVSVGTDVDVRPYAGGPAFPGHAPFAGSVGMASTAGNISIRSGVFADGASAAGAGLNGGGAGGVTLRGGDVRVGNVQASGGATQDQAGGNAGPIRIGARGRATLGSLTANGGTAATGGAGHAAGIEVLAARKVVLGAASASGPSAPLGGGNGSTVRLRGTSIVATGINAGGGSGTLGAASPGGGAGGKIDVVASDRVVLPALVASGGNGAGAGPAGGGGSVTVVGSRVLIYGGVDVTGGAAPSAPGGKTGAMTLRATGPLTVVGTLDASGTAAPGSAASPGGRVAITAGGDAFIAGINVSGANGGTGGSAAGVTVLRGPNIDLGALTATGGNGVGSSNGGRGGIVDIVTSGDFTSFGAIAPAGGSGAGGGAGGPGGVVGLTGDDIAVTGVDVTGGAPGASTGGLAGHARLVAFGDLHVLNAVDASGTAASGTGAGTDGGAIYLRAGDTLTAGSISVAGGGGGLRGGHGSRIDVLAHDATIGAIAGDGGSGAAGAAPAGHAGGVFARLTGRLDGGALTFRGGNGAGAGGGASGGTVDVTAADLDIASATTAGGTGGGRGANGGPVKLDSTGDLTVIGTVQTDGAQGAPALGPGQPGFVGGTAGTVLLRAAEGTLSLAQGVTALGGRAGGPGAGFLPGAAGGRGGAVNVVARHIGALQGIETTGGDGSGPQDNAGPGGDGGGVLVWSDDSVLDGSRFVATGGGVGIPGGLEGGQSPEQSPSDVALSKKRVSFSLRSPHAARVGLVAQNGPQTGLLVSSARVAGPLKAPAPLACVAVRYSVVAIGPSVGWISNPGGTVRAPATKNKRCRKAPTVTAIGKKLVVSLGAIAPTGYGVRINTRVAGLGIARAEALVGTAVATSATAPVLRKGRATIHLHLPPALRHPGTYVVRLSGKALVGSRTLKTKATFTLEVRP
ncbi:MAG: hypothetical protein QOE98_709 [Gaiellaceae bacterium]|nr:hypothetical protein [Gaiellaceae bacterium]